MLSQPGHYTKWGLGSKEQITIILAKVKEKAIDKKNLLNEDEFKEIFKKVTNK